MFKKKYQSEKGSVGFKFILVMIALGMIAHGLYNYIPLVYNAADLRQEIQAAVMQSTIVPPTTGTPMDVTKRRILMLVKAKEAPADTFVEVKQNNGVLYARVYFNKTVPILPFGLYNYKYNFDYSADANGYIPQ